MENFYFGVENLCEIKFHSTEEDNERFEWFADYDKVLLKNGFGIDEIIVESKEIYNTTDIPKYFELIYENKSRYFTKLRLSTYMMNKFSLGKHFQPVSELIRDNKNFFFLIDSGDYIKLNDIVLSDVILKAIRDGICKVVLNTSYEPYSNEQIAFIQLVKAFAYKYKLTYSTLKIVSGNLIVKNNLDNPYEFIPYCYFLEHPWFVVKESFIGEKYHDEKILEIKKQHSEYKSNFLEINSGGTISYGSNDIAYRNSNGQTYLNNASGQSYWYSTLNLGLYAQQQLRMWITNLYVGIGTSGPAYELDVNGQVHATCFPTSSDIRFKKNIVPLENALEKVLALRGVSYEWNEFIHSVRDGYNLNVPIIGMIAQEVEQIIPQIVGTWKLNDELTDAKALEYQRLVPYLIEAIKEQQTQINDLKTRISILENK